MTKTARPGTVVEIDVAVYLSDGTGDTAATIDTATTRLDSHPAAVPTVSQIGGSAHNFKLRWTGLTPAVADGDIIYALINGTGTGGAWSEWIETIYIEEPVSDPTLLRKGENIRWTNQSSGAGFDVVAVTDEP